MDIKVDDLMIGVSYRQKTTQQDQSAMFPAGIVMIFVKRIYKEEFL